MKSKKNKSLKKTNNQNALILCGGGIFGALYELGVLKALNQTYPQYNTFTYDIYIGTSAGSIMATMLANGINPEEIYQNILDNKDKIFNFKRKDVYDLSLSDTLTLLLPALRKILFPRLPQNFSLSMSSIIDLIFYLQENLPSGIFPLTNLENFLREQGVKRKMAIHFKRLKKKLYLTALDIDTGERVVFGPDAYSHIPIYKAICCSCAIPGFYQPPEIDGRFLVDGGTGEVAHIDVAVEKGAKKILVINPIVPIYNDRKKLCLMNEKGKCGSIVDKGIIAILEQSFRILYYSTLELGLKAFLAKHPDIKVLLIEPKRTEDILLQNPMSMANRELVLKKGYTATLEFFKENKEKVENFFS